MYLQPMGNAFRLQNHDSEPDYIASIYNSLQKINNRLEQELAGKQISIEQKDQEIQQLKSLLTEKDRLVEDLYQKNREIKKTSEGNRQMVKKLINDVMHKQQDIEWYKRTYESRSLLGTIWEKIFGRKQ